jgi:hypothetical protein
VREDFAIEVPRNARTGLLTLTLMYAAGPTAVPRKVADLEAEIQGEDVRLDRVFRDVLRIQFDAQPPDRTAFIHVTAPKEGQLEMVLYLRPEDPQRTPIFDQPGLDLERLIRSREPPRTIRNIIRHISQTHLPELFLKLVSEFVDSAGGPSVSRVLVVCDHANSEIPWELVEFEDDRYLGAEADIVRWLPVRKYTRTFPLSLEESSQTGAVVAFCNGPPVEGPDTDEEVLRDRLACALRDDWSDLTDRLKTSLPGAALVYFYCHGTHDFQEVERWYLDPDTRASDGFPIVEFNEIPEHDGPRPVFFVNACHSGRLIRRGGTPYGLATILLARAASGFIGTLGSVRADVGARIAGAILLRLQAAREEDQPHLVSVLRQLRAEAAARVRDRPSSDDWNWFLFVFMYVYYGRPFLRLGLLPGPDPGRAK